MSSYCMKSCAECPEMEHERCRGCRDSRYAADCMIANCCRNMEVDCCINCGNYSTCMTVRCRKEMPQCIHRHNARVQRNESWIRVMAQWLPLVFWCSVARLVFGTVMDPLANAVPDLAMVQLLGNIGLLLGIAFGYWQLSETVSGFRFASVYHLIMAANSVALHVLPEEGLMVILLSLVIIVLDFVHIYMMCDSYRGVLSSIDPDMGEKWQKQWNHFKIAALVLGISILLLLIPVINLIGVVGFVGGACFLVFVIIREVVYIYQTMSICRNLKSQS